MPFKLGPLEIVLILVFNATESNTKDTATSL